MRKLHLIIAIFMVILLISWFSAVRAEYFSQVLERENSLPQPDSDTPSVRAPIQLLIPLYIYPSDDTTWLSVVQAASEVPVIAIINPNSGPNGGPPNEDYARGIRQLRQANVKLIGYVYTEYSERDIETVKAEIDLYNEFFDVSGIFLDQVSSSTSDITYYQELYGYIRSFAELNLVVTNQGTNPSKEYFCRESPTADVMNIFEQSASFWADAQVPSDDQGTEMSVLIHSLSGTQIMRELVDDIVNKGVRYIYVTDDTLENPWNNLPSYFPDLVSHIAAINRPLLPELPPDVQSLYLPILETPQIEC